MSHLRLEKASHPTRGYVAPFSVNFCPDTWTNPVELGGGTDVVELLAGVVVETDVVLDVGGVVVVAPGKHCE